MRRPDRPIQGHLWRDNVAANVSIQRLGRCLWASVAIGCVLWQGAKAADVPQQTGAAILTGVAIDKATDALTPADQSGRAADAAPRTRVVYTRAVIRSLPNPREPHLLRLKLLPGDKLAFTTVTFRVADDALWRGLHVGDHVGFVAEPRPEGNTVVRLRQVTPCVRFRPCPALTED